ncbi:MAG: TonB C-terminal domain-containing protein, partial [Bdellovibrionales bacterium]|nr:TonB C-terminal domain-containing protein [Bdellovibrionales bacterium]
NTKKVKEEQDSALARLRAMQKLKEKKEAEEETQKVEFKGNALSQGNSLTGLEKLKHESYLGDLDAHIKNFWNLPEWLASDNLSARVLLLIRKDGVIIKKSFVLKSGNTLFDQHVLGTLDKASPLPAPPDDLVNFFETKGVEVRFPE